MSGRRPGSSCKPCRKARIGCDAILRKENPCTNCVRRGKICTRNSPITDGQQAPRGSGTLEAVHERSDSCQNGASRSDLVRNLVPDSIRVELPSLEDDISRRSRAMALHAMLSEIFLATFENRFTLWLGPSCMPYLETTLGTKASVSRTVLYLDKFEDEHASDPVARMVNSYTDPEEFKARKRRVYTALNDAFRYTVYAYSSRWIPLRASFSTSSKSEHPQTSRQIAQELQDQLWNKARLHILPAISNPSYRSILALLLFSLTERPAQTDDPGISSLCAQTLLSQFHRLQPLTTHLSKQSLSACTSVSPFVYGTTQGVLQQVEEGVDQRYRHLRDSMLWLGILCDMSQSAIHRVPSVILPGNTGDEKAWDFIRQRTVIFDRSFRVLNNSLPPLTEDVVVVLLQHASACKTMYLGVINQFRDSLSQGNVELIVERARKVADERQRFHGVFDQLLAKCARDFLTMTLAGQLNYFLLVTHQSLGSLVLAEILDDVHSITLPLESPASIRLQACSAVVHTLSLVLNYDHHSSEDLTYGSRLLHDPLPELMVEVLSETGKAIYSLVNSCDISVNSARVMLAVVSSALSTLSQISKTASFALSSIQQIERTLQLKTPSDSTVSRDSTPRIAYAKLPVWDANIAHDFLHEMETRKAFDSSTLEGIIREYDSSDLRDLDPSSFSYAATSEGSIFSYHLSPDSSNSCDQ